MRQTVHFATAKAEESPEILLACLFRTLRAQSVLPGKTNKPPPQLPLLRAPDFALSPFPICAKTHRQSSKLEKAMSSTVDARLLELGITLPEAAAPAANYVPFVITGNQLFVSGQLPMAGGKLQVTGKLGDGLGIDEGKAAAKLCAINLLAQAKAATGNLDKVVRLVKIVGFVNSTPDFTDQPQVINGASDFLVEAMGDKGRHARSAVSAASLPFGAAVEIEAIFEIES
jgi:enamine deaminase RidA (YjgF/YER057c/UK114 family)